MYNKTIIWQQCCLSLRLNNYTDVKPHLDIRPTKTGANNTGPRRTNERTNVTEAAATTVRAVP